MKSKTPRAVVIGWPAGKSKSPELYKAIAGMLGREIEYERLTVAPHELAGFVDRVRRSEAEERWVGFNVTIPHKEAMLRHLDVAKPEAKAIGAVNVVTLARRQLAGDNTDAGGFLDALNERGVPLAGVEAAVYGAGGAARAVGWALGGAGAARVHFVNRGAARAIQLAGLLGPQFPKTRFTAGPEWPRQARLWINATPLGMDGFPSESPLPPGLAFPRDAWAYDLVYRPAETPFLKQAAAAGCRTIGGAEMLVYQALRTWELWFEPLGSRRRRELKAAVHKKVRW